MSAAGNTRETWSNSFGFILAAIGSAVGLGNIWKFPYITGQNGGGAFVLVYLFCIALIGLPILISEMTLGRRGRQGAFGMFTSLASPARGGKYWGAFGLLTVITAIFLLSFYSVVGGWAIAYLFKAISGVITSEAETGQAFGAFIEDPAQALLYHAIFMAACIGVVIGGVSRGIERASRILMPAFALLLLILFGYSLTMPGIGESLRFMFSPDFSKLTAASVLEAMGHSFFTLSLGMGVMIVYGSYLRKQDSIFQSGLIVVLADTAIALVAGVTIFSIVFSAGQEPAAGPGLVFVTLPGLFANLPFSILWAIIFFLLLAFAALTSGISILEVPVSFFVERLQLPRGAATLAVGGLIFLIGIACALSFGALSDITIPIPGKEEPMIIFDAVDYFVSNWALTIGGLGVTLLAGWGVDKAELWDELKDDKFGPIGFAIWYGITRFIAPIAVVLVLLSSIGVI